MRFIMLGTLKNSRTIWLRLSMSCKGMCWDNALMESIFDIMKNQRTHG